MESKRPTSRLAWTAIGIFVAVLGVYGFAHTRTYGAGLEKTVNDALFIVVGMVLWVVGLLLALIAFVKAMRGRVEARLPGVALAFAVLLPCVFYIALEWWPTPRLMMRAAYSGDARTVQRCLDAGIDVNYVSQALLGFGGGPSPSETPLTQAVQSRRPEVVRVLLEAGADVDLADGHGMLPLHSAVMQDSLDLVRMLVEAGADLQKVWGAQDPATPRELAVKWERKEIEAYLAECEAR